MNKSFKKKNITKRFMHLEVRKWKFYFLLLSSRSLFLAAMKMLLFCLTDLGHLIAHVMVIIFASLAKYGLLHILTQSL